MSSFHLRILVPCSMGNSAGRKNSDRPARWRLRVFGAVTRRTRRSKRKRPAGDSHTYTHPRPPSAKAGRYLSTEIYLHSQVSRSASLSSPSYYSFFFSTITRVSLDPPAIAAHTHTTLSLATPSPPTVSLLWTPQHPSEVSTLTHSRRSSLLFRAMTVGHTAPSSRRRSHFVVTGTNATPKKEKTANHAHGHKQRKRGPVLHTLHVPPSASKTRFEQIKRKPNATKVNNNKMKIRTSGGAAPKQSTRCGIFVH